MHAIDWDALRVVLALAREGSYAAAGRVLKVNPTTIARRLTSLEGALGSKLFDKDSNGRLRATEAGEIAVKRAETVEAEIGDLSAAVAGADMQPAGTVRLTAVPIIVNRILVPALPDLLARHPGLQVELVAETRDLNLTRRDADIAIRLARPDKAVGQSIIAKRIGMLHYEAYAAKSSAEADLPWLTYGEQMAHLPQARWLSAQSNDKTELAAFTANDAEALLAGVLAGLGRALLPTIVADRIDALQRTPLSGRSLPAREIWSLTHPDLRHLARIRAVLAWLEAAFTTAKESEG